MICVIDSFFKRSKKNLAVSYRQREIIALVGLDLKR
jgi:hypothetical protein